MLEKVWSGIKLLGHWCKGVIEETPGVGSTSRVVALIGGCTVFGLLIAHWHMHHTLPDHDTLTGFAILLSAALGGYGLNKISGIGGGGDKG